MKVTLEDLQVPTSWDELNLQQLKEISSITEEDKLVRLREYVKVVLDLEDKLIDCMEVEQLLEIWKHINFIEQKEIMRSDDKIFEVDGKKFGLVQGDYMKLIEYVEAVAYIANPIENFEKIVVALLRPILTEDEYGNYTIEDYDMVECNARQQFMLEKCSAPVAYQVLDFFLLTIQDYIKDTLTSLEETIKEENNGSVKNGDGQV